MKGIFGILLLLVVAVGGYLLWQNYGGEAGTLPPTNGGETIDTTREGNLVRNNPGLTPNVWHVVYEAPGAPALTQMLQFDEKSLCTLATHQAPCNPEELEQGMRVHIEGNTKGEILLVRTLARIE